MATFNILSDTSWESENDRDGYRHRVTAFGRRLGASLLGGTLYELPPGEKTWPYHYEQGCEEWLRFVPGRSPPGAAVERRARRHYTVRGYRILAANAWAGGYELDLVARRGRRVAFVEVKAKTDATFVDPVEMVGPGRQRRLRRAAESWLAAHPELDGLEVSFDVMAERAGRLERLANAF